MKVIIIFVLLLIVAFVAFRAGIKYMLDYLQGKFPAAYAVLEYEFDMQERGRKEANE